MNLYLLILLLFTQPVPLEEYIPETPFVKPEPKSKVLTYAEGCAESLRTGKDLFVYVGIKSKVKYGIVCEKDSLDGYPEKCIVLSQPYKGGMVWVRTMDENGKIIPEKEVSQPAPTFLNVQTRPAVYSTQSC